MKNLLAKIWIPALLVTLAGLQTFGIDIRRAVSYKEAADTLVHTSAEPDTTNNFIQSDTLLQPADSILPITDSLRPAGDSLLQIIDSLPQVSDSIMTWILAARDSIKAPDSLKTSDPVFFKYYVAIKECTVDESDEANIGILSVYIIEAENWVEDYVYRGDGEWIPGIHIVTSQMPISN